MKHPNNFSNSFRAPTEWKIDHDWWLCVHNSISKKNWNCCVAYVIYQIGHWFVQLIPFANSNKMICNHNTNKNIFRYWSCWIRFVCEQWLQWLLSWNMIGRYWKGIRHSLKHFTEIKSLEIVLFTTRHWNTGDYLRFEV